MKNKKTKSNVSGVLVLLLLLSGLVATVSLVKNGTGMFPKAASTPTRTLVYCDFLTVIPETGSNPLDVTATINGRASYGDKISYYYFDFGDGTAPVKSTAATKTHKYTKTGNFIVKGYVYGMFSGKVGGSGNCMKTVSVNEGSITVDKTSIVETLDRANADSSGLIYGNGFNITSQGATGFQIRYILDDGRIRQGEGFYESSGGMTPGQTQKIRSYLNPNKDLGTYTGSVNVEYYKNGKWNSGPIVNYSLTLIDSRSPINIDKNEVVVTMRRSEAEYGMVYKPGFTINSTGADGFTLYASNTDGRIRQGEGFYESSGGLVVGRPIDIRAYINTNKPNGTYSGNYLLKYSKGNDWYDSDINISYTITLTD